MALLEPAQARVVGEQLGQDVAAVVQHPAHPAEVVEAHVVHLDAGVVEAECPATRRPRPDGVSQMPSTRSPSTVCMASVMMPAGLVKFMTYGAGGQLLRPCAATSSITGTVRIA